MQIEIKKKQEMSLYDCFRLVGEYGCDICDDIYDWGTYLGCQETWDKCHDYYDKCMLLFALNLTCIKYNDKAYSCCDVSKFLWKNREPFERFFNEENKRDYTPAYWLKKGETIDPDEDGLFYDIYMESFESLLIGNYSESDYRKLYKYLTEWDKWGKINKGNAQETKAFVEECLNDVEIQVEDGEECFITRYNFSKDKNSMMNLDNLNALHDNIFKETDYIVAKIAIIKGYAYEDIDPKQLVEVILTGVTSDSEERIDIGDILKPKGLLKAIFNNQKVIQYLKSVSDSYDRYIESFKIKEE